MNILLISVLFLNPWGVEERTGSQHHPVLDFSNVAMPDSILAYDVQHYDLSFDLDIPAESLSASVVVDFQLLDDADSMVLHFVGLEVSHLDIPPYSSVTYERVDTFLIVHFGQTLTTGGNYSLQIEYHGQPTLASSGFGKGMYINPDGVTYTCNAPWGAKYWFACQDNPRDKATMDMSVTVPEGYEIISNGILESADRSGPQWTFNWQESHPIATYLIAFAAGKNYALTADTATVAGDPVPICHWVLEPDSAEITPLLLVVKDVMEYFSELFYPYPFADEKYAHVATPVSGAMENQTCTHINTDINWGDWDVIVAHEFSHSWWGDATTCGKLKHMWLNEGFATYCEALWIEHRDGPEAYQEYYEEEIAGVYLGDFSARQYTILDPPWEKIYSTVTYEKPASVLHMLRRIVGEDDFFIILRTYGERYQDSTALSEDFEAVVAEITGSDYSWFFNQWLRAPAHPEYLVSWDAWWDPYGMTYWVSIDLYQTQEWPPEVPVFRMPVEFGLVEGSDTSFYSFVDSIEDQSFEVMRSRAPDEVIFDPHGNLLCEVEYSGVTEDKFYPSLSFVCPSICRDELEYSCESDQRIDIALYDVSGRRVEFWEGLEPQGYLDLGHSSDGVYFLKVVTPMTHIRRVVIVK